jgi:hypothetical protein
MERFQVELREGESRLQPGVCPGCGEQHLFLAHEIEQCSLSFVNSSERDGIFTLVRNGQKMLETILAAGQEYRLRADQLALFRFEPGKRQRESLAVYVSWGYGEGEVDGVLAHLKQALAGVFGLLDPDVAEEWAEANMEQFQELLKNNYRLFQIELVTKDGMAQLREMRSMPMAILIDVGPEQPANAPEPRKKNRPTYQA